MTAAPAGLVHSIQVRLKNEARDTNRPVAELLELFAVERFLHRLGRSEHREKFVLSRIDTSDLRSARERYSSGDSGRPDRQLRKEPPQCRALASFYREEPADSDGQRPERGRRGDQPLRPACPGRSARQAIVRRAMAAGRTVELSG